MKCLQCGTERVVKDVRVVDRGHYGAKLDLTLEVQKNPEAFMFKGAEDLKLKANVCAECGFVMLSISPTDAKKLENYSR